MAYPSEVAEFITEVTQHFGPNKLGVETEETKGGHWWIDLRGSRHLAVEWRPGRGFGFSRAAAPAFGEGPTEVFLSPRRAACRVAQVLSRPARTVHTDLAAVRELYGFTQNQLAAKLRRGQPAIARLEAGRDSKIETIQQYIHGLGGKVELRAVFRDGFLPIPLPKPEGRKHATTKFTRLARA